MDSNTLNIFAKLTIMEFLLEVKFANWLVTGTEEQSEAFLKDLKRKSEKIWAKPGMEGEAIENYGIEIVDRTIKFSNNLISKVHKRENEIRQTLAGLK